MDSAPEGEECGLIPIKPKVFRTRCSTTPAVVRPEARLLLDTIESLEEGQLLRCQQAAERLLLQMGITFNVYGDSAGTERIFPFDLIPRIVRAEEWDWIERGLKQRIHALNEFIDDIYHDQKILKDEIIPRRGDPLGHLLPPAVRRHQSAAAGLVPHHRHRPGAPRRWQIYVLEDNLRVPSGVSYVLENRELLKRIFPQVFEGLRCGRWTNIPAACWRCWNRSRRPALPRSPPWCC